MLRCPHDARSQLDVVLSSALQYLRYDPNFADDMEEGEGGEGGEDEDDAE